MTIHQLRRVRLGVRATFALGLAVSLMANVLHAGHDPISKAISAWPPIALMLTVELISRVPVHRRGLATARLVATAAIAAIAGWVSYWHMASVAATYGEASFGSQYLWPLTVDGMLIVASVCLVEIGGRMTAEEQTATLDSLAGQDTGQLATDADQPEWSDPWDKAVPAASTDPDAELANWTSTSGGQHEVQAARTAVATRRPLASYDQNAARNLIRTLVIKNTAATDIDREVAGQFDISERTARRLRGQVTGQPVSGPPATGHSTHQEGQH